jgi:putative restriction endonuclease
MTYTNNARDNAHRALPHLVYCAHLKETITYGEIGRKIGIHHRPVRFLLGYIRDEICLQRDLPLLNVIVVKQNTGLPGESFLPEGTRCLTDEEYRRRFEELRDQVFAYEGWDDLLADLGLTPLSD